MIKANMTIKEIAKQFTDFIRYHGNQIYLGIDDEGHPEWSESYNGCDNQCCQVLDLDPYRDLDYDENNQFTEKALYDLETYLIEIMPDWEIEFADEDDA